MEPVPPSPITWPNEGTLTNEWVHGLMSSFEWSSWNLPPSQLPSVMPVNLHDLLFLLKDAGYPSQNQFYVFNGDYVDRGAWGLETFLVLLSWKVLMPDRVFLLRGNHESKYCTSMRFEGSAYKIRTCLHSTRRAFPQPVLPKRTRRGIGLLWGPDCTEEFLKKYELKLIIRSHEGPDAREKRDGLGGMDIGYTIDHNVESGKLITIFSAPDYPQFQATEERYRNKGAYIILQAPDFSDPQFRVLKPLLHDQSVTFVSYKRAVNPFYDFENVIDSDDEMDKSALDTNEEQATH
ncbi:hypothetical protein Bca52824_094381 [Brassica carinata]|uniref:Serine/threonine-protein phosphatase n=1 Tax=Brassica carinata TaxID=52824 RepID=A0A8X7P3Y8_BRACI|nr:hypothetical protein Bca52824_094381 [Brassica carinata]